MIANADGAQRVVDDSIPEYQRAAVTALMTHEGVVPGGDIGDDLIVPAPGSPFGVRENPDAVIGAFDRTWKPKSVVLVEASDLLRADLYGAVQTSEQQRAQKLDALRRADMLVGRLLQRVDPQRDAVLVVGPTSGGAAVSRLLPSRARRRARAPSLGNQSTDRGGVSGRHCAHGHTSRGGHTPREDGRPGDVRTRHYGRGAHERTRSAES